MRLQYGIVPVVVLFLVLSTITPVLAVMNNPTGAGMTRTMTGFSPAGSSMSGYGASGSMARPAMSSMGSTNFGTSGHGIYKPNTLSNTPKQAVTPTFGTTATTSRVPFGTTKSTTTNPVTTGAATSGWVSGTSRQNIPGTTSQEGPFGATKTKTTTPKAGGTTTPGKSIDDPAGSSGTIAPAYINKPAPLPGKAGAATGEDKKKGTPPKSIDTGTSTTPIKSITKAEGSGERSAYSALAPMTIMDKKAAESFGVTPKGDGSNKLVDRYGNEYLPMSNNKYLVTKSGDTNTPIPIMEKGSAVSDKNFFKNFGGYGSKRLSDNTWEDAAGNIWEQQTEGHYKVIKEGTGMKPPTGTGGGSEEANVLPFGDKNNPSVEKPGLPTGTEGTGYTGVNVLPSGGDAGFTPDSVPAAETVADTADTVAQPTEPLIIGPPQGEPKYDKGSQAYYDTAGNLCLTNGKDWGATGCGADAAFSVTLSPAQESCSFNSDSRTYVDTTGRTCWSDGKYWFTQ